ncbi:MAG: tripartite tricarboxylate transporter substrate binding protein [Acetobacteraceae bacterium]|nr:tripartite tricarboxylate transporter substrate binding protein [Acetobacteraceae bacterium]
MQTTRRGVLAAAAMLPLARPALAQEVFPSRPLRMIVPFAPGGPLDIFGRPVAERLGELLGQPVVFESRPGANGIIGAQAVATARPDGYTLLLTTGSLIGNMAFSPRPLPYDTMKDLAPVTLVGDGTGMMLVGNTRLPGTMAELVALAKQRREGLSCAMTGIGNITHLAIEQFKEFTGAELLQVTMQGTGPSLTAILAGSIDLTFSTIPPAAPFVRDNRLRAFGYTGRRRPMILPDVPTMKDLGYPEWELIGMLGLWTTGGTPMDRIVKVQQAIHAVVRQPAIERIFNDGEFYGSGMPPDEFAAYLQKELAMQLGIARRVGLSAN